MPILRRSEMTSVEDSLTSAPLKRMLPVDPGALHQIVHPVETAQQRRLAAAGRSDKGGHLVAGHVEVDPFQGMGLAVVEIQVRD